MKAMVLSAPGQRLEVMDVPVPSINDQEVLVRVQACGVCHSDLHISDGLFTAFGLNTFPIVPGHEITGIVDRIGAGVSHLNVGDRVGVYWLTTCGHCPYCADGQHENCTTLWTEQRLMGMSKDGGYAEYVKVNAAGAMRLPDEIDFVNAAPLFCAGLTMYGGIKKSGFHAGQRVAVLGIGGLGHLGLQIAKAMGAEVIAVTGSENKRTLAREFGAHQVVVANGQDVGAQLKAIGGVDVVLSTTLDTNLIAGSMQGMAAGGTLVLLAVTTETIAVMPAALLAMQHRVIGSIVGNRGDMLDLLKLAAKHNIRPQTETYALEQANAVHDRLRSQQVRYRAVLTVG